MRRALLIATAGLLAAALPAHADYKRSYANGLEAAAAGRWDEVEARMQEAVKEEATPAANVKLYGMRFETYVPQYYLGLVAKNRGNCEAALGYWRQPAVQSILQSDKKLSGPAQANIRECEGKRVVQDTRPPPEPAPPEPKPAQPEPKPAQPEPKPVQPEPKPVPPPQPPPQPKPTPTPVPVETIAAPTELVAALDNYLGGRYAQATQIDPARLEPKARYHGFVVRAAARYVQSLLQGEEAAKQTLGQAEADVRAAKQLDPRAGPDAALYSPRFQRFYAGVK